MTIGHRTIQRTGTSLSELGFGVWTIASGWWGSYTEDEAHTMLRQARDLGVTFFNTGNVYGTDGYGERLVRDALGDVRAQITIGTTFGYDTAAARPAKLDGHAERPHDWSRDSLLRSLEQSLEHLGTDYIDVWQLHNPRMDALKNDDLWELLYELRSQGVVRAIGPSIGPAIGWRDEGMFALEHRDIDFFHHIYNMLEQDPGREFMAAAAERDVSVLVRVPHSSGLLEDRYTIDTRFPASDHRSHRTRDWLVEGLEKIETLRFLLENRPGVTMGQLALAWLYSDSTIASVQPNIYNIEQLQEFARAGEVPPLTTDELSEVERLFENHFGVTPSSARGERLLQV